MLRLVVIVVTMLALSARADLCTLRWEPVDEARGYRVEWRPVGGQYWISQKSKQNEVLVDSDLPIEFRVYSISRYLVESLPSEIYSQSETPKEPSVPFSIIQIQVENDVVYGLTDTQKIMRYDRDLKRWLEL